MVIATGWALAVMTGVFTAIACGSPGAHLNPAVTLGFAVSSGDFSKLAPYAAAQITGRDCRRHAGVAVLPAALERDPRSRPEAGLLLHVSGHPAAGLQPALRSHRHVRAGAGGERHLLQSRGGRRPLGGPGPLPGGEPGMGHRSQPGWNHRVMPSIRRETWARASRTRCCRWPARADRIGAMRPIPVAGPLLGGALAGLFARLAQF